MNSNNFKKQVIFIQKEELQKLRNQYQETQTIDQKTVCKRINCFPTRELVKFIPEISDIQKQQIAQKIKQIEIYLYKINPIYYASPITVIGLAYYIILNKTHKETNSLFGLPSDKIAKLLRYIRQKNITYLTDILKERTIMHKQYLSQKRKEREVKKRLLQERIEKERILKRMVQSNTEYRTKAQSNVDQQLKKFKELYTED